MINKNTNYSSRDTTKGINSYRKTENIKTHDDFVKQVVAESRIPSFYPSSDIGDVDDNFKKNFGMGIQYGRWLSRNWRLIYGLLSQMMLYDMGSLLNSVAPKNFKKRNEGFNLGFDRLDLSIGANGNRVKRATGFYDTQNYLINFRRHGRLDKMEISGATKQELLDFKFTEKAINDYYSSAGLQTFANRVNQFSGLKALWHEYGHFIDYEVLNLKNKKENSMSGDTIIFDWESPQQFINSLNSVQNITSEKWLNILRKTFIKGKDWSNYGNRMSQNIANNKRKYYYSSIELWARFFESYVYWKLRKNYIGYVSMFYKFDSKKNMIVLLDLLEVNNIEKDMEILLNT